MADSYQYEQLPPPTDEPALPRHPPRLPTPDFHPEPLAYDELSLEAAPVAAPAPVPNPEHRFGPRPAPPPRALDAGTLVAPPTAGHTRARSDDSDRLGSESAIPRLFSGSVPGLSSNSPALSRSASPENGSRPHSRLIRTNSEDGLDNAAGFWRRFEARTGPDVEDSSWLEKSAVKSSRWSRTVWIVGLVLALVAAAAIGIGIFLSLRSNSHARPDTPGGAADITGSGGGQRDHRGHRLAHVVGPARQPHKHRPLSPLRRPRHHLPLNGAHACKRATPHA
ncbi:hypothetical protein GGX14DRAFT_546793 [Mycena pura]|uniref:Uncharacterized protein n=1 Tax=Mycena pura TaxID=153505 RepID=A0AAD6UMK7_9AGAR|nr:hypothetical protein GGX14DRAFT_546793 [Mycena pura]